jgi:hypothetical protein
MIQPKTKNFISTPHRIHNNVQTTHLHLNSNGVESECQEKKCSRQLALNAIKNAKCPSNPTHLDQFTAVNAGQRSDLQDPETDTKLASNPKARFYSIFFK